MRLKRVSAIFSSLALSISLGGGFAGVALAEPSAVFVSKNHCSDAGPGTPSSPYCTVQEGVDAVAAGGIVKVDSGTYNEQVVIAKDNITVDGQGKKTVIQIPDTVLTGGSVVDINAQDVQLSHLTVSGPFNSAGCNNNEYGIKLENGASANITNSRVTMIQDANPALRGCQQGIGILVGRQSLGIVATATISNTQIDSYQKGGIVVSNTGSSATISNVDVTGIGSTPSIAQNGIQVSAGATASLNNVNVKNNLYSVGTDSSTGILLFSPGHVSLNNVTANNNDVNVYASGVQASTFNNTTANKATYNGVYVDSGSTGNTFNNTSAHDTKAGTGNYDVEDDSHGGGTLGTANTWHNTSCKSSLPAGLCKK